MKAKLVARGFEKDSSEILPQPAFICEKLTIETPEQGVEYVQS